MANNYHDLVQKSFLFLNVGQRIHGSRISQIFAADMGVDLGGSDMIVTKQLLTGSDMHATVHPDCRYGVAKLMR